MSETENYFASLSHGVWLKLKNMNIISFCEKIANTRWAAVEWEQKYVIAPIWQRVFFEACWFFLPLLSAKRHEICWKPQTMLFIRPQIIWHRKRHMEICNTRKKIIKMFSDANVTQNLWNMTKTPQCILNGNLMTILHLNIFHFKP